MVKTPPMVSDMVVRDSKSGRFVTVRGVGALKGRLKLRKSVDLTKPIASQAVRVRKNGKAGHINGKH